MNAQRAHFLPRTMFVYVGFLKIRTTGFIGELTVANVTASAPNTPSMIRATSYAYDPATAMLQSTTTYAGTPPALRARPHLKFYDDNNWLTKSYKRDAYGNIIETDITGSNIAPRSESVVYDDQNQYRFVKTQTNVLGQQTHYTYDSDFGNIKTLTDANNQTLTNDYDSFGRLQTTHHDQYKRTSIHTKNKL